MGVNKLSYNDWVFDEQSLGRTNHRRQSRNRIIDEALSEEMEALQEFDEFDYIGAYDDES